MELRAGDAHYKAYVGPPDRFDYMAATQFRLLAALGLRQHHKLLDFGCGSLRAGRLFIPYLEPGRYYGIEPNEWLVSEGIRSELGESIVDVKKPSFAHNDDFQVHFDESFDFIVAQSIFSHASIDLISRALASFREHLDGLAVVTFIEGAEDYSGSETWVYPGCVSYRPRAIRTAIEDAGLFGRRLFWFHPAQTWYVLAKSRAHLPSRAATFMLLGGETPLDPQYRKQGFVANRLFQAYRLFRLRASKLKRKYWRST